MINQIEEYNNKNKKAVVLETDLGKYVIDFYENDKYTHTIMYTERSLQKVKKDAEDYTLDIFHPNRRMHESREDHIQQFNQ